MVIELRRRGRAERPHRTIRAAALALVAIAPVAAALSACDPPVVTYFAVTSTVDAVDADPGDGTCATTVGDCTLRAAVQEANAWTSPVQIDLQVGATYLLTLVGAGENADATGDLDLSARGLVIEGHNAIIDAGGTDRALHLLPGADVAARFLTVTHGSADKGGGILIEAGARADILAASIEQNQSTGWFTCLVARLGYNCRLPDSQGQLPVTLGGGGGLRNDGELLLNGSTVMANTMSATARCGTGPLISWVCNYNEGAGLYNTGTAYVANSTFAGNTASAGTGGGIADIGTAFLQFVTFTENTALATFRTDPACVASSTACSPPNPSRTLTGGGALAYGPNTTAAGTIFAGNGTQCAPAVGPGPVSQPIVGHLHSQGGNVGSDGSCPLAHPSDLTSTDPELGPLRDNGGPTLTSEPGATSPALDAIPAAGVGCGTNLAWDQRGQNRQTGNGCDAGAVERSAG